ncbi:helix-turn-helix transcriptional regulator [Curtobacterium flaccumfaciens]|nr:helix-turn-helix transcriptional regulator [Curtobacterium flaccumfaciens]
MPEGATLAAWWLMVRQVAADMLEGPEEISAEHDLELTRFAAAGLLTAVPHWPTGANESAPARARLARAEAFLLDHVLEPITVEQVAAAAGMSTRGLQSAFQRAHTTTPMSYLRGIRLQMARDLLENAAVDSVADAARAVAMPHLGRFASAYRAEFGQLPETSSGRHGTPSDLRSGGNAGPRGPEPSPVLVDR